MTSRSYGQFCGLARAMELIGDRWSVLIVRDLLLGPKRFDDLCQTLPKLDPGLLASRLRGLERDGVLVREQRQGETVVWLTEFGEALKPALLALGLWGARVLGDPSPGDIFSEDTAILALHATFRPEQARGVHVCYQLRFGEIVITARVADGVLLVDSGVVAVPDLVIETPLLKHLMSGEIDPTTAIWHGLANVTGDPAHLSRFVRLFHIPAAPALSAEQAVR